MAGYVITVERNLLGWPVQARATFLDTGLLVLVTGGCLTHVGAVSTGEPDGAVATQAFPGHKDQFISEPWARALAQRSGQRACVVCGIHYDHATGEEISAIVATCDEMLRELMEQMRC